MMRPEVKWALSVAADTPFLPEDLVARLHEARSAAHADLACAESGGRNHPVIGLWPVEIRLALRHFLLEEGQRRVDRFTQRFHLVRAQWPVQPRDPFFNANAPDDLAAAEAMAG